MSRDRDFDDTESRIKRIETRLTRMMIAMGFDPYGDSTTNDRYILSTCIDPKTPSAPPHIRLAHSGVTITNLWKYAVDNDLADNNGEVEVILGGEKVITLHLH